MTATYTNNRQRQPKKLRPTRGWIVAFFSAVAVAFPLAASPARAGLFSRLQSGIFGDIYGLLTDWFPEIAAIEEFVSRVENALFDPCSGLDLLGVNPAEPGWCEAINSASDGSYSDLIEQTAGALGLPDPNQARRTIDEQMNGDEGGIFIGNSKYQSIESGNISDRVATTMSIDSVLSDSAQMQMEQDIELTASLVQEGTAASDRAQSLDVTQDILKEIAQIEGYRLILEGVERAATLKSQMSTQYTNINLRNLSRTQDMRLRREQADRQGAAENALRLSATPSLF